MGGRAIVMSSQPVSCRHAPAVPRHQPRELELRNRRRQVVADAALVLEELSGHHGADRVASPVVRAGMTASITVEAGDRVGATWLQLTTDHIAITHVGSIRTSRRTRQASARVHPARPPRHTPVMAAADGAGMRAGSRRARLWAISRAGRPGRIDSVSVQLNHTIVSCRDQHRSAAFLTGILGGERYRRIARRRGKKKAIVAVGPLHPDHHLASALRPTGPLHRPRTRLLRAAHQPRTPQTRPHPPTRSPRLQSHPRTSSLTRGDTRPGSADAAPGAAARPVTLRFSD